MRAWTSSARALRAHSLVYAAHAARRIHSVPRAESVRVPCASSGSITLDLFNLSHHTADSPLMVYLPPTSDHHASSMPPFLSRHPVVKINYRWSTGLLSTPGEEDLSAQPHWPTPIHDLLFGYTWILKNLSPPGNGWRDVYVYGSHLGAGLATALALTESHPSQPVAIRGLVAHNGVYNWTTFLPDHPMHKTRNLTTSPSAEVGSDTHGRSDLFASLEQRIPHLFAMPADLFDPFASPCLFFQTTGMLVPEDFDETAAATTPSPPSSITPAMAHAINTLSQESIGSQSSSSSSSSSSSTLSAIKPTRKGYLTFPPRKSTLRIPQTLLLHDSDPLLSTPRQKRGRKATRAKAAVAEHNSFRTQAEQLAAVMRRSVEKLELKDSEGSDSGDSGVDGDGQLRAEAEWRVRVADVGDGLAQGRLSERADEAAGRWLEEMIEGRL